MTKNIETGSEMTKNHRNNSSNLEDYSLYPKLTNFKNSDSEVKTSHILFDSDCLPLNDKVFNKMHPKSNILRQFRDNREIIENNKKIKYVMYKNKEKSIDRGNLLYDDFMRSPKSYRSKSMYNILKLDKNYIKFKKDEKEIKRKIIF